MIEEDEYEHDSVYETHVPCPYSDDIIIKPECPEYDEFDDYYEDEVTSNVPYSFRPNESVAVDVMLEGSNDAQSSQINCANDIAIPPVIYFIYTLHFSICIINYSIYIVFKYFKWVFLILLVVSECWRWR